MLQTKSFPPGMPLRTLRTSTIIPFRIKSTDAKKKIVIIFSFVSFITVISYHQTCIQKSNPTMRFKILDDG